MPIKHFIRVDLPAPFSPIKACTDPLRASSLTLLRARTPGNCLEIPSILSTYSFTIVASLSFNDHCLPSPDRQWSSEDSFHECLIVFLGDGLVGNPDDTVDDFRVGFLFDHQISSIDSLITLANGILEHGVVQFALGH